MTTRKPIRIGSCVRYADGTFTLAFIEFKKNGDVILSQHYGDYQQLDNGTKFNPHVTYHADGTYHVAHFKGNPADGGYAVNQKRQSLNSSFRGFETLVHQGFGTNNAKILGRVCSGHDHVVTVDSDAVDDRSTSFEVDLLEPGFDPATIRIGPNENIIRQELIKDTFPWCLVTIHRSHVQAASTSLLIDRRSARARDLRREALWLHRGICYVPVTVPLRLGANRFQKRCQNGGAHPHTLSRFTSHRRNATAQARA